MKKIARILVCLIVLVCLVSCMNQVEKKPESVCEHKWVTKVSDGCVYIESGVATKTDNCCVLTYCTECGAANSAFVKPCTDLLFSTDGSVSIGNYSTGDVYIPAKVKIDGSVFDVTCIKGFYVGGETAHQKIKNLYLNESIASIDANCFNQCYRLEEVTIPSNASVGKNAFSNCTGLSKVTFLDKVEIGANAFSSCTALKEVVSLKGVDVVKENTAKFSKCYLLIND